MKVLILAAGVITTAISAIILIYFLVFHQATSRQPPPPNIILILADDLGYNDFSYHGSNQIPTPNIDALGYHGQILEKFYAQSICTPSRAALLTGNYPIRSGMQGSPLKAGENRSLPSNMPLLSEHLKNLGYSTHLVGKWHLGAAYRKVTPTRRGFDTHFGYWNGFIGYFDHEAFQELPSGGEDKVFKGYDFVDSFSQQWDLKGEYATELFTQRSLRIIDEHNHEKPLFLYLSHLAGHTGSDGEELGVPNITETNSKYAYIQDEKRRRYADLVNILDSSVGKVVSKLAEKNLLENSIIIFMSDNGAPTEGVYANTGSNYPLRGIKQTEFEGGVRVACTLFSPLLKKRGIINKNIIHITDLLPTLYSAAGGSVRDLGNIDGIDQWHTIQRNTATKRLEVLLNINEQLPSSALIYRNYKIINASYTNGIDDKYYGETGRGSEVPLYDFKTIENSATSRAIRSLDSKYSLDEESVLKLRKKLDLSWCRSDKTLVECKPTPCLFDLEKDPCETTNIYENEPEIAAELTKRVEKYWKELVKQTNRPVDLNANPKYYNNSFCTWLDEKYCKKTFNFQ